MPIQASKHWINTNRYWARDKCVTAWITCLATQADLKVCHVHVVLSTLYQEKMVTEQEMEELKPLWHPWDCLVKIQCTKPPDVVKRTTELLAEVGRNEEGKQLKGQ